MVLLFFSCRNLEGDYQECSLGREDIESCFDMLSVLVNAGCQLIAVSLSNYPGSRIWLPVEAFDGQPMKSHLQRLQQEWEEILY